MAKKGSMAVSSGTRLETGYRIPPFVRDLAGVLQYDRMGMLNVPITVRFTIANTDLMGDVSALLAREVRAHFTRRELRNHLTNLDEGTLTTFFNTSLEAAGVITGLSSLMAIIDDAPDREAFYQLKSSFSGRIKQKIGYLQALWGRALIPAKVQRLLQIQYTPFRIFSGVPWSPRRSPEYSVILPANLRLGITFLQYDVLCDYWLDRAAENADILAACEAIASETSYPLWNAGAATTVRDLSERAGVQYVAHVNHPFRFPVIVERDQTVLRYDSVSRVDVGFLLGKSVDFLYYYGEYDDVYPLFLTSVDRLEETSLFDPALYVSDSYQSWFNSNFPGVSPTGLPVFNVHYWDSNGSLIVADPVNNTPGLSWLAGNVGIPLYPAVNLTATVDTAGVVTGFAVPSLVELTFNRYNDWPGLTAGEYSIGSTELVKFQKELLHDVLGLAFTKR
jgi:hypothetical protein